jgi:hypothetical protein
LLWPFLWLLSLPFRIVAVVVEALFALLRAVLFLPPACLRGTARPPARTGSWPHDTG